MREHCGMVEGELKEKLESIEFQLVLSSAEGGKIACRWVYDVVLQGL